MLYQNKHVTCKILSISENDSQFIKVEDHWSKIFITQRIVKNYK